MSPARVTSPQGIIFFVEEGEEIHNKEAYDHLPLEDKLHLASEKIIGTGEGYTFKSNSTSAEIKKECRLLPLIPGYGARWLVEDCTPVLILPKCSRLEPITNEQMENELKIPQKPSLRDR